MGDTENPLAKMLDIGEEGGRSAWVRNTSSCVGICFIGFAGWVIAWQMGLWKPAPQGQNGGVDMAAGAQVLGYISALCYLGYVICLTVVLVYLHANAQSNKLNGILTMFTAHDFLRSGRTTAKNPAKVSHFCSFFCRSWGT